jgi:hypothetical protein
MKPEEASVLENTRKRRKEWARGWFCAVAYYLRENCKPGVHDTAAKSMFNGCNHPEDADIEDRDTFKQHGLM